ncbi:minor capsid protein [Sphingomonas paucimobilis]|uniref:minor capsid protein n=1 Tax=Sphingomonas paucimobilis TaxID=13689 RepID=UPI0031D617A8
MPSVNEELQDRAIRHALAINGYGKGLSDKIVRLLNSADADLVDKLAARLVAIKERGFDTGPKTTERLRKLLDEIRAINSAVYADMADALTDELIEFGTSEAGFQKASIDTTLGISLDTKLPSPVRLRAIVTETPIQGTLLSPWVEGMSAGRIQRIEQQIRLGMVGSETTDQIVARIRGTKALQYRDGILEKSRQSAQSMVRTAVSHVSNVASQETWKANAHVVKGWQFLATLDGRTTITCAGLSGQFFPIGEGPIPPLHIRCRSVSVPVTKSFKELGVDADELPKGTRASMDGQVAADTTFADFLKRKGDGFQDQVLGKTRADLWRNGKLDLADFIKSDGTVLTLDQLRKSYPGLLDK